MRRREAKRKIGKHEKGKEEAGVSSSTEIHATKSNSSKRKREDSESEANIGRPRNKVKRAPKPEPEYFEDKRNLEDLWKSAFPVGTEWDQLDKVYEFNWNFSNLEEAFEENGKLHGKRVYLFGCSEPQLVSVNGVEKVICVPAVVAIVSKIVPSEMIGIKSVQREKEEIVSMKYMKMGWIPYIPLENRDGILGRLDSQIFILSCHQRRSALRHLKIERLKKFEYCLPYFENPLKADQFEQSTEVQILFPVEPKPVFCEFDWEMDDLEEFTSNLIEEEALSEDQKDAFKEFVKEKVREAKKSNREKKEEKQKKVEEMSEETKNAFAEMMFYKFYPVKTDDTPDISHVKAPFINRYYGKAHEVL